MIIFKEYGIIISKENSKYFIEYSDGSFAEKIVRDGISKEEADIAMKGREQAAKLIDTLTHKKADNELKMKVKDYIKVNYNENEEQAEIVTMKLYGEKDIFLEFVQYIALDDFIPEEYNPVKVKGYTAQMIENMTYLDSLEAYNYLIYIRTNPKEALFDLKNNKYNNTLIIQQIKTTLKMINRQLKEHPGENQWILIKKMFEDGLNKCKSNTYFSLDDPCRLFLEFNSHYMHPIYIEMDKTASIVKEYFEKQKSITKIN